MFKSGDVVYYRNNTQDIGVVDRPHESLPEAIWVNWTGGPDRGLSLHCEINDLTLYTGIVSEYGVTEYDVATLKKLLDKMDDNIVFSFSDLKIHFNK